MLFLVQNCFCGVNSCGVLCFIGVFKFTLICFLFVLIVIQKKYKKYEKYCGNDLFVSKITSFFIWSIVALMLILKC